MPPLLHQTCQDPCPEAYSDFITSFSSSKLAALSKRYKTFPIFPGAPEVPRSPHNQACLNKEAYKKAPVAGIEQKVIPLIF